VVCTQGYVVHTTCNNYMDLTEVEQQNQKNKMCDVMHIIDISHQALCRSWTPCGRALSMLLSGEYMLTLMSPLRGAACFLVVQVGEGGMDITPPETIHVSCGGRPATEHILVQSVLCILNGSFGNPYTRVYTHTHTWRWPLVANMSPSGTMETRQHR